MSDITKIVFGGVSAPLAAVVQRVAGGLAGSVGALRQGAYVVAGLIAGARSRGPLDAGSFAPAPGAGRPAVDLRLVDGGAIGPCPHLREPTRRPGLMLVRPGSGAQEPAISAERPAASP